MYIHDTWRVFISFNQSYYTQVFVICFFHLILTVNIFPVIFSIFQYHKQCWDDVLCIYTFTYLLISLGQIYRNGVGGSKSMHIWKLMVPFSNYFFQRLYPFTFFLAFMGVYIPPISAVFCVTVVFCFLLCYHILKHHLFGRPHFLSLLITSEVKYFFICLLTICFATLEIYLSITSLSPGGIILFFFICKSALNIGE